jgi:hypothetical protein
MLVRGSRGKTVRKYCQYCIKYGNQRLFSINNFPGLPVSTIAVSQSLLMPHEKFNDDILLQMRR